MARRGCHQPLGQTGPILAALLLAEKFEHACPRQPTLDRGDLLRRARPPQAGTTVQGDVVEPPPPAAAAELDGVVVMHCGGEGLGDQDQPLDIRIGRRAR
jgi:hypothetical protein